MRKSQKEIKAIKDRLAELSEFKDTTSVALGKKAEILFTTSNHICNNNLNREMIVEEAKWKEEDKTVKGAYLKHPKTGDKVLVKTRQDVIDLH